MPERFRFINGRWEVKNFAGQWGTAPPGVQRLLGGFDNVQVQDGIEIFTDSSGKVEPTTLKQMQEGNQPVLADTGGAPPVETDEGFQLGFTQEALDQYKANLYWWPTAILGEPFFPQQTDFGIVLGPLDPEFIQDTRREYLEGKFGPILTVDQPAAEIVQRQNELGAAAAQQGRRLFDEAGTPTDQVQFTAPDGRNFTKTSPIMVDSPSGQPVVTDLPELGPNTVSVAFPDGTIRVMSKETAPRAGTLAQQMGEAFAQNDQETFNQIWKLLNTPTSLQQIIAEEFAKGTPEGLANAQEAFDFANQTTKKEAMELALRFAQSPADALAWSALGRGDHRNVNLTTAGVPRTERARTAFDTIQAEQQEAAQRTVFPPEEQPSAAAPEFPTSLRREGTPQGDFDRASLATFGRTSGGTFEDPVPQQPNLPDLAPTRPSIEVAPQINQQPDTGLDAARVAATQAGAPGQAPAPEPITTLPPGAQTPQEALEKFRLTPESGTPAGAAASGTPQFRNFGQIETEIPGEFKDIRVSPTVAAFGTGGDVGQFDFNTTFREIGIAAGIGENFRPGDFGRFNRMSPTEKKDVIASAQLLGISEEDFFAAMRGGTPGGFGQGAPRLGVGGRRGLA